MPFELAEDDGLAYVGRIQESGEGANFLVKNHFDALTCLIKIQIEYAQELTDLRYEISRLQKVSSPEECKRLEEIDAFVQKLQQARSVELYHRKDRPQSVPRREIITLVM